VYVFSFIDRQIMSLLVRPLRRDLNITDTQVSILMGLGFAIFYTLCGIPLGRLADTRSRRAIIAAGLVAWSFFTALCGLAKNFGQMLLWRIGVGVGEASLSPSAYSLITDYFPKERLATAISVYSMGIYLGAGLSYLLGGIIVRLASMKDAWIVPLVGAVRPWQVIFFAVGLPGLLVVFLMLTVKEPIRRGIVRQASGIPFSEVFKYILENKRTFLSHNIGFGFLSLASYASGAWVPEFFRRDLHWEVQKTGVVYGTMVMIFGSIGIVGAGMIGSTVAKLWVDAGHEVCVASRHPEKLKPLLDQQAAATLTTRQQTAQQRRALTYGAQTGDASTISLKSLLIGPETRHREVGWTTTVIRPDFGMASACCHDPTSCAGHGRRPSALRSMKEKR